MITNKLSLQQFKEYHLSDHTELKIMIDKVFQVWPNAMIAGGFVRDTLLRKEWKDIDILLDKEPLHSELETFANFFFAWAPAPMHASEYSVGGDWRKSELHSVWKVGKFDILWVSSIFDRINDFPDNLSKVGLDRHGLWVSDEFTYGHSAKHLVYRVEAGLERFERFKRKFPDYSVTQTVGELGLTITDEDANKFYTSMEPL